MQLPQPRSGLISYVPRSFSWMGSQAARVSAKINKTEVFSMVLRALHMESNRINPGVSPSYCTSSSLCRLRCSTILGTTHVPRLLRFLLL